MKAMAALVLGLGLFTACSSNDDPEQGGTTTGGSTYMSVAINLSAGNGTRAVDEDNQKDTKENEEPDYNFVGKWAGKDKIKAISVYVFANDKLEANEEFATGNFEVKTAAADKSILITPSKGIKVLPGEKTVYVVVNPTQGTKDFLPHAVGTTTLADFKLKYENVDGAPDNFLVPGNTGTNTTGVKTSADNLASVDNNEDVITMTAIQAGTVDVKDNVSEKATLDGEDTNRAKLEVKRTVARVMVTTTQDEFEVRGDDPLTTDVKENEVLGKVTNIKYVVAQGENSIYFMQRNNGATDLTYKTPNSEYVPNIPVKKEELKNSNYTWAQAGAKYDYSGLWKDYVTPAQGSISGTKVPKNSLYNKLQATALQNISDDLMKQLSGQFILPNTHKWGKTQETSNYRKGNTAYVLVRAQFRPKKVVMNTGDIVDNYGYPAGKTFYLGANGVFYESVEVARDVKKHGVENQTAAQYVNGKTLYYAWVNPDNTTDGKWLNSPVNRNNIYHIEISGFKRIGANWNPLVPPTDPEKPNNPLDPNNPDPKPEDDDPNHPNEPNDPPVNPNDPLTPKETWMSVQTTILPWNVHSYSVVLDM